MKRGPNGYYFPFLLLTVAFLLYFISKGRPAPAPAPAPDGGSVRVPGPSILVLDMDETMIRTVPSGHTRVIERPFVREFLRDMHSRFDELVVFTAGTRDYASPILDRLEIGTFGKKGSVFKRRFYRDSCSIDPKTGLFVKDLRILGVPLDRVWILDNTPSAYALQPERGIPILSFEGDPSDRALIDVRPLLANLLEKTPSGIRQVSSHEGGRSRLSVDQREGTAVSARSVKTQDRSGQGADPREGQEALHTDAGIHLRTERT